MSWTRRTAPIQVGDRVCYSTTFLRSISAYTGDLPFARGTVTALKVISPEVTIATIDWGGNPEIPSKVNVRNLARISAKGISHD